MSNTASSEIHEGGRCQGIAFAEVVLLHNEPQFVVDVMSNAGLLLTEFSPA
ncbi:hypothetical protein ACD578_28500 (plasmid) [Microvirga sp. RSM25]|uniref:hypothetical protein n=1 Tax=Microvirga sp. RSM25 TaxID=3273802 RepID=UPI003850A31B